MPAQCSVVKHSVNIRGGHEAIMLVALLVQQTGDRLYMSVHIRGLSEESSRARSARLACQSVSLYQVYKQRRR